MDRRQMLGGLAAGLAAGPLGACGAAERLASLPEKLLAGKVTLYQGMLPA